VRRGAARPRSRVAARGDVAAERIRRHVQQDPLVALVRHERVGVRPAGRRHAGQEHRCRRVRDVEHADALEAELALAADERGVAARAGLRPVAARLRLRRVDGLEEVQATAQAVDRHVVLRPAAEVVHQHRRARRVGDVEDAEAVVVAGERQIAPEGEVGVRRAVLVGVADERHVRERRARERRELRRPGVAFVRVILARVGTGGRRQGEQRERAADSPQEMRKSSHLGPPSQSCGHRARARLVSREPTPAGRRRQAPDRATGSPAAAGGGAAARPRPRRGTAGRAHTARVSGRARPGG
jgi:hypothetical protein